MTTKENYLKCVRFETPDYIPMSFAINGACYNHYPYEFLNEMLSTHKLLFPNYVPPKDGKFDTNFHPIQTKNVKFKDDFSCIWETAVDGFTGTVTTHPLADWENYKTYKMPDPAKCNGLGPIDWNEIEENIKKAKANGELTSGGLRHGHTFLQLSDMLGYEKLLCDMVEEEPLLFKLIAELEEFNSYAIKKYTDLNVDVISFPEDLGMQIGPMVSPKYYRQYIQPSVSRMMQPVRKNGIHVHMHSDGDIRDLVDDLIEGGVDIINLQDLVNGIDWIKNKFAGKICIDLDIDRQNITTFGTPKQIDDLIKEEVQKLGSKQGGLMMIHGCYPGPSMENIKALMDAMEKYMFYYN